MKLPETITANMLTVTREESPSAFERLKHLCPSRYFRYYMLFERTTRRTCWLPEGFKS